MEQPVTVAGRITTHVLDTAAGRPGAGISIGVSRWQDGAWVALLRCTTNLDGRCDAPLVQGEALVAGLYELSFGIAAWRGGAPGFYDDIPIRFRVTDPSAHHHVPLILSPFGYATYRGS